MTYTVYYSQQSLWRGKAGGKHYTLHRAGIIPDVSVEPGPDTYVLLDWQIDGYALLENGEFVEAYSETAIEPGNGFYGEQVSSAIRTPHPPGMYDPQDIVEFTQKFAALCEEHGTPLKEGGEYEMRPSPELQAVIGRKRYRVGNSILIAHDSYWDGGSYTRYGRNTYLYRTPTGLYFAVHLTQWQGERDRIEPLDVEAAYALYERLPEKEFPVEMAFPGVVVEEA